MVSVAFREGRPDDWSYVLDSFRLDMRDCAMCADIPGAVVASAMRILLESWTLTVAHPTDDDTTILGWLVSASDGRVGWCHVRAGFRKCGIAAALVGSSKWVSSQVLYPVFLPTRGTLLRSLRAKGWTVRFRPYEVLTLAALGSLVE